MWKEERSRGEGENILGLEKETKGKKIRKNERISTEIKAARGSASSQENWGRGRRAAGSSCRRRLLGGAQRLRAGRIWL